MIINRLLRGDRFTVVPHYSGVLQTCGIIFPWMRGTATEVGLGWARINADFAVKKYYYSTFYCLMYYFCPK